MIKISVFYEDNSVSEFQQEDTKDITIGRAAGCSVHLDEASISRLHALITFKNGTWNLVRKANFGAVLLNGQEIENAPLEGGEEITVGKFSLRVNIGEEQAVASNSSQEANDVYREDGEGRTQFVSAGVKAVFRFEPGTANVAEFLFDKDVSIFGRGSNCDVVLTDKKASRKHFEVKKQGLSFFLKDLDSANGLTVNGVSVKEAELVPGDVIQIGESKIEFVIENAAYFSQQDQFLPVPSHLQQPATLEEGQVPAHQDNLGIPGISGGGMDTSGFPPTETSDEPPLSSTDYIGRAKRAWSKIPKPQRMRYLTILVVFALITALLGGPDEPKKAAPKRVKGSTVRTYEQLTAEKKKFVRENYSELLKAQEKKDFMKMLDHTRNILTYVDDYRDTKTYENMAKKRIEELDEEKRRAEDERKREETRKFVKALEEKGKELYEKALEEKKFRPELEALIQEIYTKDPNNRLAQEWKNGIKQKDLSDKEAEEMARKREEEKQKAEDQLSAVRATFESGKYKLAIKEADALSENGWTEKDYLDRIEALKQEIRSKLSSILDPLLREAALQRQEGGDLVKANEKYSEVLAVDASNQEALVGKAAIKEILHLRAKRFYAEAILAESVNDLSEAKDRFEKCLKTAPEEDVYKKRCKGKLARFDYFNNSQ
jgi:pSer/pThr/pTyr-binding forkhead associated (FHA) protein